MLNRPRRNIKSGLKPREGARKALLLEYFVQWLNILKGYGGAGQQFEISYSFRES